MPPSPASRPTRRWLLAAIGVLGSAAAGCTAARNADGPTEPAADVAARDDARRLELDIVAAYDEAVSQLPALAATLALVRDHHAEHARALGATSPAAPTVAPSRSAVPPQGGDVPAVLDDLARREAAAADSHRDGCQAASGALASLLASLRAAETCHVDLLVSASAAAPPTSAGPAEPTQPTEPTEPTERNERNERNEPTQPIEPTGTGDAAATLEALSAMLAVEHAAVYASTTAGGMLAPLGEASAAARQFARESYQAHRERRDALTATIAAADGTAPAAYPAYQLPITPSDPTSALALLADVEDRCAAAAHDAIAALGDDRRSAALTSLTEAARRAQRIRLAVGLAPEAATRPLPGA